MRFTSYVAASAFAALASAQTFTDCDPTKKDCPNNPAMPATFETNFKAGKDAVKGWKQTAGSLNYAAGGAEFTIAKKGDAPTIQSEAYLHFGYIEVKMKAAPGQGIISSIVLQSDDLDEVDWEFIGSVDSKAQMNYFGKGNTTTYDRMIEADVASAMSTVHTYALNWTAESLTWIIDDKPMRTLKYADANGGKNYPQTPVNVRIGNWAGGDSENAGTVQWAGGKVDYSKAPFTQTVESVKIINYSPGKEYHWKDRTGSYQSIEVIDKDNKDGSPVNSVVIQPSASAAEGGAIGSGYAAPSGTATATGASKPAESTSCSEGEQQPKTTASPQETPAPSGPAPSAPAPSGPAPSGPAPSNPAPGNPAPSNPSGQSPSAETPCSCGIKTVTVTGNPPPPESATAQVPPAPPASSAPVSSAQPQQPPVTPPASAAPPYPTTPGLVTDTAPAPSVPAPSAPTGVLPSGNGTTPAPPEFTGAASHNKAGVMIGAVAGAILLAF